MNNNTNHNLNIDPDQPDPKPLRETLVETPTETPTPKPRVKLDFRYTGGSAVTEASMTTYIAILAILITSYYPLDSSSFALVIMSAGIGAIAWLSSHIARKRHNLTQKAKIEPYNAGGSVLVTIGVIILSSMLLPDIWSHGLIVSASLVVSLIVHILYLKASRSPQIYLNSITLGVLAVGALITGLTQDSPSSLPEYVIPIFISAFVVFYLTRYITKKLNLPKELGRRNETAAFIILLGFLHIGPFLLSMVNDRNIMSPLWIIYPIILIAAYIHSLSKLHISLLIVVNISFAIFISKVGATPTSFMGAAPAMDVELAATGAMMLLLIFMPISFGIYAWRTRRVRRALLTPKHPPERSADLSLTSDSDSSSTSATQTGSEVGDGVAWQRPISRYTPSTRISTPAHMMSSKKERIPARVKLIGLPLLVVGILLANIVVPRLQANPKHDFIYIDCVGDLQCLYYYTVIDGKIDIINEDDIPEAIIDDHPSSLEVRRRVSPDIYHYSIEDKESTKITLEEANHFTINPAKESSDGYTLEVLTENRVDNNNMSSKYLIVKKGSAFKDTGIELNKWSGNSPGVHQLGWIE